MRAGDLLAAMLVRSANDACYALAERVGGSAAAFVGRMNQAAARLGMTSTRFIDPCGLDQRGQHTTAADLLLLAKAALEEPRIVALAEERSIRVETVDRARSFTAPSTNALLDRYDGAFGLKTGYTSQAGACVIATARRGETVAIVVILGGGKDRWSVAVVLLDHAFDQAVKIPRVRDRATIGRPDP